LLDAKVVVCLGAFAWDAALRLLGLKSRFAHGAEATVGTVTLLGCYHPSQQNTFTGVLTPAMLNAILLRARELAARR
jgi:uracil-DNA glycosylase